MKDRENRERERRERAGCTEGLEKEKGEIKGRETKKERMCVYVRERERKRAKDPAPSLLRRGPDNQVSQQQQTNSSDPGLCSIVSLVVGDGRGMNSVSNPLHIHTAHHTESDP